MEKADPLFLLIGLPTIPIVLILGRMIRWEEAVLKFWRKHSAKLPLLNYLFPSGKRRRDLTHSMGASIQIARPICLAFQLNAMDTRIQHR